MDYVAAFVYSENIR